MSVKNLLKIANQIENKLKNSFAAEMSVTDLFKYFTKNTSAIYKALPPNLTDGEEMFYQQISNAACQNPGNEKKLDGIFIGRMQNIEEQFSKQQMNAGTKQEKIKNAKERSYSIYSIVWSAQRSALAGEEDPMAHIFQFDSTGSLKKYVEKTR